VKVKPARTGRCERRKGVLGSGTASVGIGFVSALWIIRWSVVRGDFSAKISWEGSCGIGGESVDREAPCMRTITKRGRRRGGEERLGVHEKKRMTDRGMVGLLWHTFIVLLDTHILSTLSHQTRTRTRTIAARVSMLSAISNKPATFSILRFDLRTSPYWIAE